MRKKKTIAKLVDEAATILQKIVRLKAADDAGYCTCVTCGTVKHWKEMHGGHFIPRNYRFHKLREENIHPQCPGCNTFHPEMAKVAYTLYMIDMYGRDFVDWMEDAKHTVTKYPRPEILEIIEDFKEQLKELERE